MMRDDQDLSRWFTDKPLSLGCWPVLAPETASALLGQGAVLIEIDLSAASGVTPQPVGECDVVLVSSRIAPPAAELAAIARTRPLVLHLEGGDDAGHGLDWQELRRGMIAAGVQDLMTTGELSAPSSVSRLEAAALRHRLTERARSAYATDLATGLPHRQQLLEHMSQLLALRRREPAPMGLLVLHLGAAMPNPAPLDARDAAALRRKVAVRLRSGLRASDVVASLGDDEFAVLLTSVEAPADIERVVSKLMMLARRPLSLGGQPFGVELSSGIARYPDDGEDAVLLLRHAEQQARSSAETAHRADRRDTAANDPSH